MIRSLLLFSFILLLLPAAYAQGNAAAIQKRWVAVDVEGDAAKKKNYAERFARQKSEIEFKKGTVYFYKDGVLDGTAKYTMAPDGKSILLSEANGVQVSMKIASLSASTLKEGGIFVPAWI
ncbi:MAG: hypothetical protein EOO03_01625 [Chitinophagaceae bacterium]|nr:MAG: hypothetical protein EOO03_01625 [Chitinophagaceae bacterium]